MLTGVYETLRAAGRPLELAARRRAVARAARSTSSARLAPGSELVELLDRRPARRVAPRPLRLRGQGRRRLRAGAQAVEQAALNELAARDRALLEELLQAFERSYQAAKDRESALDFEDLQLRARDLLARERGDPRARAAALPPGLRRRVPGHEPSSVRGDRPDRRASDLFFVGDEFQSIYRFRHADVDVFKERREAVGESAPADRELALAAGGARCRQPALRGDVR